jgi:hypothetical protein
MSRRMSCSLTIDAVRNQTKTVTRRHADTWRNLLPGDRLTLVEKAMGLPKGSKQVVLAEVEVVSVRYERLYDITQDEVVREGFPEHNTRWFIDMWLDSHKHGLPRATWVRRIEWRYLP